MKEAKQVFHCSMLLIKLSNQQSSKMGCLHWAHLMENGRKGKKQRCTEAKQHTLHPNEEHADWGHPLGYPLEDILTCSIYELVTVSVCFLNYALERKRIPIYEGKYTQS